MLGYYLRAQSLISELCINEIVCLSQKQVSSVYRVQYIHLPPPIPSKGFGHSRVPRTPQS